MISKDNVSNYTAHACDYYNETVQVEIAYANSYSDAVLGKQVAGGAGEGVFAAAEELDLYVVGVDADQKYLVPQQIICSVMKQVGDAVYQAVSS